MRIVVAGLIGAFPIAGLTFHYLQYVLGLRSLGHQVLYLEDTGAWYYDPWNDAVVESNVPPLTYLKATMDAYDLGEWWTFVDTRGEMFGLTGARFRDFLNTAELLIHVTGAMYIRDEYLRIPCRAYIDTDPGFIQFRIANGSEQDLDHLRRHTTHFSFGGNLGQPDCLIPTGGFTWRPTAQPVCLDLWPAQAAPRPDAPFTTLVKWRGYEAVEHRGEVFDLKAPEFVKFRELPRLTGQTFELAMAGSPPLKDLEAAGWRCRSGPEVSSTIANYQRYLRGSRGEWSVAKNAYVRTRGGWFSDRSATYLASGRPVVLQSTGFERWLPTGQGLLGFSSLEEARSAIDLINQDYPRHSRAARELAESFFDSRAVLGPLVEVALAT